MAGSEHSTDDHSRDPCPLVIVNDFGGAFAMGAIGGSIWYSIKGFRNSPYGERWQGVRSAVRLRAPTLGGNFGTWGGMFASYDCAIKSVRKTEDPWNAILSGAMTGGTLAVRGGWRQVRTNFIIGGIILAVIEGVGIALNRYMVEAPQAPPMPEQLQ